MICYLSFDNREDGLVVWKREAIGARTKNQTLQVVDVSLGAARSFVTQNLQQKP